MEIKQIWPLFGAVLVSARADIPPSCYKQVYCDSKLLHHVQMARIFNDSKTFVDLQMRQEESMIMSAFDNLLQQTEDNPTKEQLKEFVEGYFDSNSELDPWTPADYNAHPEFLDLIQDKALKQFAKDINAIWPNLGRKVSANVSDYEYLYSFVPVEHGFIIPGGRFKEIYYWDTYWIVKGLLISGMYDTAKGMIENLVSLLKIFGHIPNGSRWYYQQRSQPPLLSSMLMLYYDYTQDKQFLKDNLESLETELKYWLRTQQVDVVKNKSKFSLLRYYVPSRGPRPESYYEDYEMGQQFDKDTRQHFYTDIKSAAETGWDFSSRWLFHENGTISSDLNDVHTRHIIPVDLNAIFANALANVATMKYILNERDESFYNWLHLSKKWIVSIREVLWDDEDGIWYDYNNKTGEHRKYFYPSNLAPLWMNVTTTDYVYDYPVTYYQSDRIIKYLRESGALEFNGGVPTSTMWTGEQWDYPNAWPPLVSIVVNALQNMDTQDSKEMAFEQAQKWVRACHKGFSYHKQMFEKYDVENPGEVGGGGEYQVQDGFGWSNGVVLEFLDMYGDKLTVDDYNKLDNNNLNS